jgi:hypothetical protein
MSGEKHTAPTPTSEQFREAFDEARGTARSASEIVSEAEDKMIEVVKEAKASLPDDEFRNFRDSLDCPEYLLEEIEDALGEVDEETDQDDDEAAD